MHKILAAARRRARGAFANAAEVVGLALVVIAAYRISPTLGLAVAGAGLIFVGYAFGR